jgi:glycosyltransferase involved in cell wall biosynthesis
MEHREPPLVSIGVPVFNGENSIARALDSLLEQDYPHIEIVISDNGSTDGTQAICERYARTHRHVTYSRVEPNAGAPANFNRVFRLATGKYFMWAAHDDERDPSFVSSCVERLEQDQGAVLCQVHTAVMVEGRDDVVYVANLNSFEGGRDVLERYRETLKRFPSTAFYGVYRSSAVRATRIWSRVIAADLAFIQELSLYGYFIQVPRVLFRYRTRPRWNTIQQDAAHFLGRSKPWWYVPFLMLLVEHMRRLATAPLPVRLKLRLAAMLLGHEMGQLALKVILKIAGRLCPQPRKEPVGRVVYWKWMHNPNLQVVAADVFYDRMCKPRLGSWV